MTNPNAKAQAAYRARQAERLTRRGAALTEIVTTLDGNDKPLAVKIRGIAEEGLK